MTDDGVRIRLVRLGDAAEVSAIYGPSCTLGFATFEVVAPAADEMAQRIMSTSTTYPWLVAVDRAGGVIGFAYAARHRDRAAYRWSVDVATDASGRGIGTHLYERLLPLLAAQGFARAHAAIALPNDASVAMHRRFGFVALGTFERVGYKLGAWRDVQWWARPLATVTDPPAEPVALTDLDESLIADLR